MVDPAEESTKFILFHPLLRSHPVGNPIVREHVFSSRCDDLIISLDNVDTSTVPGSVPQDVRPNERAGPSAVKNEKKSNWKSAASTGAKLLLLGVRDSADAFGPLKSVAGGLCFILENCEVRPSAFTVHNTYRRPSERRQINKR